jgi:hypothetical protein
MTEYQCAHHITIEREREKEASDARESAIEMNYRQI